MRNATNKTQREREKERARDRICNACGVYVFLLSKLCKSQTFCTCKNRIRQIDVRGVLKVSMRNKLWKYSSNLLRKRLNSSLFDWFGCFIFQSFPADRLSPLFISLLISLGLFHLFYVSFRPIHFSRFLIHTWKFRNPQKVLERQEFEENRSDTFESLHCAISFSFGMCSECIQIANFPFPSRRAHKRVKILGECKSNQMQTNCNRINENLLT